MSDLTPETLSELRRDAESWFLIGGERVLPLLNALDAARSERDALTAKLEAVWALVLAQMTPFVEVDDVILALNKEA